MGPLAYGSADEMKTLLKLIPPMEIYIGYLSLNTVYLIFSAKNSSRL
jgi:hypothetical protein